MQLVEGVTCRGLLELAIGNRQLAIGKTWRAC